MQRLGLYRYDRRAGYYPFDTRTECGRRRARSNSDPLVGRSTDEQRLAEVGEEGVLDGLRRRR